MFNKINFDTMLFSNRTQNDDVDRFYLRCNLKFSIAVFLTVYNRPSLVYLRFIDFNPVL